MAFSVFQLKDGRWRAVVQLPNRKPHQIERKTRKLAEAAMKAWLIKFGRLHPATLSVSTGEILDAYIERCREKKRAAKTISNYEIDATAMKAIIGKIPIQKLTPEDVEYAIGTRVKAAINKRALLRAAINRIGKRLDPNLPNVAEIAENPDSYNAKGARSLKDDEYKAIIAKETDRHLLAYWRLLGETGVRPEEGRSLLPIHLGLEEDGAWLELTEAKTEEGKKPLPISMDLYGLLVEQMPFNKNQTYYYRRFLKACEVAGVKNATPYSLRHYFANHYRKKVDRATLRRLMRHTDSRTTDKYYVEMEAQELREAISHNNPHNKN